MISKKDFIYAPAEFEAEKASNSYLMSLVAVMAGTPLPIFNLLGTLIFYLGNRKSPYFVRWHCTQALLSQIVVIPLNIIGFWWTISILFRGYALTDEYIAYMITMVVFSMTEFGATIYTAIKVRKGIHVEWWFFGSLTHLICKY